MINRKGTRMFEDGEDSNGMQTSSGQMFQEILPNQAKNSPAIQNEAQVLVTNTPALRLIDPYLSLPEVKLEKFASVQ